MRRKLGDRAFQEELKDWEEIKNWGRDPDKEIPARDLIIWTLSRIGMEEREEDSTDNNETEENEGVIAKR